MASSEGVIQWELLDTVAASAKEVGPRLNRGVSGLMLGNAPKVQSYARAHAPWKDQTGNARQGLFAKYSKSGDNHVITLYHTMPYGIWLEVRNAGQYAVIEPTLRIESARIFRDLRGLIAKLGSL